MPESSVALTLAEIEGGEKGISRCFDAQVSFYLVLHSSPRHRRVRELSHSDLRFLHMPLLPSFDKVPGRLSLSLLWWQYRTCRVLKRRFQGGGNLHLYSIFIWAWPFEFSCRYVPRSYS
jgi:hypothetical protein